MIRGRRKRLFLETACLLFVSSAEGQTVSISTTPTCASCQVVAAPAAQLILEAHITASPMFIERAVDGRTFVLDAASGELAMFSANGKFLRKIGRKGGGPGEYQSVRALESDDKGNLLVFDRGLARLSVFSREGSFVRSAVLPLAGANSNASLLTAKGTMVLNAAILTGFSAGYALQEFDDTGKHVAQFDETDVDSRATWLLERALSRSADGGVWSARAHQYRIDLFGPDRSLKKSITRPNRWFKPLAPPDRPSDGLYDAPPTARLEAVWEDREGFLWVIFQIPSPDWKPVNRAPEPIRFGQELPSWMNRPRLMRMVEVIDVRSNSLVLSKPFPRDLGIPFGSGFTHHYMEDAAGDSQIIIRSLSLKR